MVPISIRMKAIADMVPKGMSVTDIGCDHGFVSIYLVTEKNCPKALAMDINKGPLERADEHIRQYGLNDKIETRLSDGAVMMKCGETDAAIIAGMGGKLINRIIEDSMDKFKSMKAFVLSPHSDIPAVRAFLVENSFCIEDEDMVFDEGKYYMIMRCVPSEIEQKLSEEQIKYGPALISKKHPVLREYLIRENAKNQEISEMLVNNLEEADESRAEALESRIRELKNEGSIIKNILDTM